MTGPKAISFEVFTKFKRIENKNPFIALAPPEWAAATHAIIIDDTVHYIWCSRPSGPHWIMQHATAPVDTPTDLTQDARNPVVVPSEKGFDDQGVEYPFPFHNPADGKYYMYYRGKGAGTAEQTGLLVSDGDMGKWDRVTTEPVIRADMKHELDGSTHPSVAIDGGTIHIIYTCKATRSYHDGLTMGHATAPLSNPADVTKDPHNPVFKGSGMAWDSRAVRETELFKGPEYFHVFYGGFDGETWRIGHVRTKDFRNFEANPYNPIFTESANPDDFDCDGILTPQILEIDDAYYMIYAGKKGAEWQTGITVAPKG